MDARTRESGGYDAIAARAHPNDDAWSPKTSSQTRLDHPQSKSIDDAEEMSLCRHQNMAIAAHRELKCERLESILPQSRASFCFVRHFSTSCAFWYRTVLHEFLRLAFVSVRLPCYDVGLVAVDVWRYDAV